MDIDILAYELKYKNDQMVLDLLTNFKAAQEAISVESEEYETAQARIADLEDMQCSHMDDRETWREEVNSIVDMLHDDLDGKKNLLKASIGVAIGKLKIIAEEMS